jgi:octaprenyl-diphosphate synthase
VGDDLAEGKPTLPLIYAMERGDAAQSGLIRKAIEQGGYDMIDEVQAIIQQTGALEYTRTVAQQEADKAIEQLAHLPESEYKQALELLALFSVQRNT